MNSKKTRFLQSIPQCSVETSNISERCKFNFYYFQNQESAGQKFEDWGQRLTGNSSLINLCNQLKNYSENTLEYWKNQRCSSGTILTIYGNFPKNSDFVHPPNIPHDVSWGRFRLGNKVRLAGFIIPEQLNGKFIETKNCKIHYFDTNTFYVVFLDKDHKFYKTEKP